MNTLGVVICHHTGDLVNQCVNSVLESVGVDYTVTIVTSDMKLFEKGINGCKMVYNVGMPATKRNEAAAFMNEKYLVFMDDDVIVKPDALRELYDAVRKPHVGMVFGKLFNAEHKNRLDEAGGYLTPTGFIWSRAEQNIKDKFFREEAIFAGKSALCIISKRVFWEVGGFDDDFGILGEESDLAWRVWHSARTVLFKPTAIGYHFFNTKYKPVDKYYTSERVQYNGCRNYITMLLKNLGKENLWKIVPIHTAIWISAGLAMLITGKLKQGWNILRGVMYVIKNYKVIMRKRKVVQSQRLAGDKVIFPFIFRKTRWGYYWQRFLRYVRIGIHG